MNNKHWFGLVIAVALVAAWMLRWDVQVRHQEGGMMEAFAVDRWTSQIWLLGSDEMLKVKVWKE